MIYCLYVTKVTSIYNYRDATQECSSGLYIELQIPKLVQSVISMQLSAVINKIGEKLEAALVQPTSI